MTRAKVSTPNVETVSMEGQRTVYEVSTLETLRYAKSHDNKGYFTFCVPMYAVRKVKDELIIKVYNEVHCDFVARYLGSQFVIRQINQVIENDKYINLTPQVSWKKLTKVSFIRKDGSAITNDSEIDDLEVVEI